MKEGWKINKKIVSGLAGVVILAVILAGIFVTFREKAVEGNKSIVIEVIDKNKETAVYTVATDAAYLRGAMEEAEGLTFSGTESEYGLMVDTINGEKADYMADGAYWSFYVNGEYCNYGIDEQPVEDGDIFSIAYTTDVTQ